MEFDVIYDEPRKGDIKDSYANVQKAMSLLGWDSKIALNAGLKLLDSENTEQSMKQA